LRLYVEARAPGRQRRFVDLGAARARDRYRFAVVEVARDRWQASIDGRSVGSAVLLRAQHGAWRGVATAETWATDPARCNHYAYRFDAVSTLGVSGWRLLTTADEVGSAVAGPPRSFAAAA
jgi:hypothetical protein